MSGQNYESGGGGGVPTGAATEAKQDQIITALNKTFAPMPGGGQLAVTDAVVVDLGDVVDTIAGAVAFPIPVGAVGAILNVKGGNAYATTNGLTPDGTSATTVGYFIKENEFIYLGQEPNNDNGATSELTTFKMIAESGSSLVVDVEFYSEV